MEKECLRLLLRGIQPVVVCPARGIESMRIPRDWRPALDEGRLLIISPFPATVRRPTAKLSAKRNDLVASLASRVFIAHAAAGSKTESFAPKARCRRQAFADAGKPGEREFGGDGGRPVQMHIVEPASVLQTPQIRGVDMRQKVDEERLRIIAADDDPRALRHVRDTPAK